MTDAESTQPLAHVKVKVTYGKKVYEDMTDMKGRYQLPVSPELYNMSFELPDYEVKKEEHVLVHRAERVYRNVQLRKKSE